MTDWLTDERVEARGMLEAFGGDATYMPPVGEPVVTLAMIDESQAVDSEYSQMSEPRLQVALLVEDCTEEPATGATVRHDGALYELDGVDDCDGVVVRCHARKL